MFKLEINTPEPGPTWAITKPTAAVAVRCPSDSEVKDCARMDDETTSNDHAQQKTGFMCGIGVERSHSGGILPLTQPATAALLPMARWRDCI